MTIRTGIGQYSQRFLLPGSSKPCVIGGIIFEDAPGFNADSDGDVVFHALCNAIASITGEPILGAIANELYSKDGITDSEVYLKEAMKTLRNIKISHVAIALEGKKPVLKDRLVEMRKNVARIMNLNLSQVGITATTGEGLTDFGCGEGVQALVILSTG